MGNPTRRTVPVTATERFHAESRRRKSSPSTVVAGLIAGAFLLVAGTILLGGGPDPAEKRARFQEIVDRGYRKEHERKFDEAAALYGEALEVAGKDEVLKSEALALKARIRTMEASRAAAAAVQARWEAFRKEAAARPGTDLGPLARRGRDLLREFEHFDLAWLPELRALLKTLEEELAKTRIPPFTTERARIIRTRNLEDRRAADFGGAIADWKTYLALRLPEDDRQKAREEVARVNVWAREELARLRRRVEREKEKDALSKERSRFAGTDHEAAFDELMKSSGN